MFALRSTLALRPATYCTRRAFTYGVRANSTATAGSAAPDQVHGEGKRDPGHAHLYYHLIPPSSSDGGTAAATPGMIALSFLPRAPMPDSRTVLGTLPAVSGAALDDFAENPAFRTLLHKSIKKGLADGVDTGLTYEAGSRPTDGYITLTDERAIPPQGRIGETEDLIGSVFVKDGKIVADTYEPLPSYRLVTPNGVCTLSPDLDSYVLKEIEKVDAAERSGGESAPVDDATGSATSPVQQP